MSKNEPKKIVKAPDDQLKDGIVEKFKKNGKEFDLTNWGKINSIVNKIQDKCGKEYIEENLDKLITTISKEINANKTFMSYFRKNIEFSAAKIDKIVQRSLPTPEELQKFSVKTKLAEGKKELDSRLQKKVVPELEPTPKMIAPPMLSEYKSSPILKPKEPKPLARLSEPEEKVTNKKVVKAPDDQLKDGIVEKFKAQGKEFDLTNWGKINSIVNKIQDKCGKEYIKENLDKLITVVSKEINANKSFMSYFRKNIQFSDAKIDKIVQKSLPSTEELRKFKSNQILAEGKKELEHRLKTNTLDHNLKKEAKELKPHTNAVNDQKPKSPPRLAPPSLKTPPVKEWKR